MKKHGFMAIVLLLATAILGSGVVLAGELAKKKQTPQGKYLTSQETFDLISSDPEKILFIDTRTQPELEFVGWTPLIDGNVPYVIKDLNAWDTKKPRFKNVANSNFLVAIEDLLAKKKLKKTSPIVLICRSGSRSAKAANLLFKAGYHNVYSVTDGFEGDKDKKGYRTVNGWKNAGLPWNYKLEKDKMYWEF
ncbi:MAG TPA: sulfurtransferase [Gammaproteobacteria bacterium]|nr:sulfurtransferase [Gammaproteobacteria bacterium]